jgi:gamma-glutamyltranspeptidase/glutathione hydrolase
LTLGDLDAYRIAFREPLTRRYHHSRVLTPGPPAAGGPMIALMLALLDSVQLGKRDPRGAEHAKLLCCAMAVADEARKEGARALDRIDHWLARFATLTKADGLPAPPTRPGPSATTHISVLDGAGNAASVTFSYGEGNAHIIGDTGIMMNNLMGEEDLFPDGFDAAPRAQRLATMMSPTLLLDDAGGITVLGTGGANRIRTAIVQVLSLLHDHGYACEPAVHAARIHYEAGVLNAEVFDLPDRGEALLALGANKTVRFDEPSLFFGGVHMVRRGADGTLSGAGDPRRGGVFRIVT